MPIKDINRFVDQYSSTFSSCDCPAKIQYNQRIIKSLRRLGKPPGMVQIPEKNFL